MLAGLAPAEDYGEEGLMLLPASGRLMAIVDVPWLVRVSP